METCCFKTGRRGGHQVANKGGMGEGTQRGSYLDIHDCSESLRSAQSTEIPSGGVISHDAVGSG